MLLFIKGMKKDIQQSAALVPRWIHGRHPSLVAVIALFVMLGMITLLATQAASSFVSSEAENGIRSAAASLVSDTTASGGEAIQFSSGGTAACSIYTIDQVAFPADAGIINVKNAPYYAKGDGTSDDTAAIRQALLDNDWKDADANHTQYDRSSPRTIFLPAGTYRISGSLSIPGSSIRLSGAGMGRTTIKLINNAAGFGSTGTPQYVLRTGQAMDTGQANSGFSNYVENLTLDIGAGNPGAVGIRYDVANRGTMKHVRIVSSDANKVGYRGMAFETSPGPGLIQDISIDGFDTGIYFDQNPVNDLVFSDITLSNQRQAGIVNTTKNILFENLKTVNVPIAIKTVNDGGSVVLINSQLDGTGTGPAINLQKAAFLYARNVTATGFGNIVTETGTARFVGKSAIKEWSTDSYHDGNTVKTWTETNDYVGLNLPVKKAPVYENTDLTTWASVKSYGATANNSADDDGPAIQRAIDSGKPVVYFPYGEYTIKSPVIVRGSVKKLDFMYSMLDKGSASASFTIGDTAGSVWVEYLNIQGLGIIKNSSDTLVVRHIAVSNPVSGPNTIDTGPNASGDIFMEDFGVRVILHTDRPVNVWARQMNRERSAWSINGGAKVWLFGDNVEAHDTYGSQMDMVVNGSTLEVIGGAFDALDFTNAYPSTGKAIYQGNNSNISVVIAGFMRNSSVGHWLSNTSGTTTVGNIYHADIIEYITGNTSSRVVSPLYVSPGYQAPASSGC
jgi:hypothetical protein